MSKKKVPEYSPEVSVERYGTLVAIAKGQPTENGDVDQIIDDLTHDVYKMPREEMFENAYFRCSDFDAEAADKLELSYEKLRQSKLLLDLSLRTGDIPSRKAKRSLNYIERHNAFSKALMNANKAVIEGIPRRIEEQKRDDFMNYR